MKPAADRLIVVAIDVPFPDGSRGQVLVDRWNDGQWSVATRQTSSDIWGPPAEATEQR